MWYSVLNPSGLICREDEGAARSHETMNLSRGDAMRNEEPFRGERSSRIPRVLTAALLLVALVGGVDRIAAQGTDRDARLGSRVASGRSARPPSAKASPPPAIRDWRPAIDETWGPGAPTAEKLSLFDEAWEDLDSGYGGFVNHDVDMVALRERYRSEIAAGVSRGRFVAIMNHLALAMMDLHTVIFNSVVNQTNPGPGVPLMIIGGWFQNAHFGASLTPLADGSLVVLRACPDHPLGLTRGDVVLGYDGRPWRELYHELLDEELPIQMGAAWGSTDVSMEHAMLISAGQNWHLFDTIDIWKHETGKVEHLSTAPLARGPRHPLCSIWGNEQLPVPGVPMPDFDKQEYVTWGVVEIPRGRGRAVRRPGGSGHEAPKIRIGYIYVASWSPDPALDISGKFHDAIAALMNNTDGLILDYRLNPGGYMPVAHAGYSLLFNTTLNKVAFDIRGDPTDHLSMVPDPEYPPWVFTIRGDPSTYYDHPIAILTGPGAISNGDWESLRSRFHPRARVFGKPSNGAFTIYDNPYLGEEWTFRRAKGSGYLIDGHRYLPHTGAPVDEEVWFTLEDVIAGRDTVADAAIAWIRHEVAKE